ncbi:glutamine--fructose-6-phosphate transaminase (isomerizing) [Streptomyces albidoflavus]
MCGIVGYVGAQSALDVVLAGLRRLEYRGYDSAGVAVLAGDQVACVKKAGKLSQLEKALVDDPLPGSDATGDGHGGATGIGHTRWATHGGPTDTNAHPHLDASGRCAVVHNGIIENFAALREELAARGADVRSQTDSEVAAHLLAEEYAALEGTGQEGGPRLAGALRAVCRRLEGAFTLVALHADVPDVIVGARRNSPLVVGCGEGEAFLASDVSAFIDHTRTAMELGQDQVVEVHPDRAVVTGFDGSPADARTYRVDWDASAAEKDGYDSFMLKEIAEQPKAVADTLLGRLDPALGTLTLGAELGLDPAVLREAEKVVVIACGTAHHAGLVARLAVERWAQLPCEVELASEFRYRDPIVGPRTLVVAVSQSGETADTLMALRHAREQGATVLAVCNTNGSTIPRESDAVLYTHAGPEVAVASTKAFLTQLVACLLLALHLGEVRRGPSEELREAARGLSRAPEDVAAVLATMEPVRELARGLAHKETVLFLGRHSGHPVALEGALKLKELAYFHAEGFAAGELKHGPIALIEPDLPVIVVVPSPVTAALLHGKIVSNIQEIRARGARTIVLAEEGDEAVAPYADHLIRLPAVPPLIQPLVAAVPLQVFACELATARGNDVDQPRNLAKSVTVE